jgi:hypothetical protein
MVMVMARIDKLFNEMIEKVKECSLLLEKKSLNVEEDIYYNSEEKDK